jgi:ribosome-associated translation inhibitor RaiA
VIDVYGSDKDIYSAVNEVISHINIKFQKAEEKIEKQLSQNKSLTPGSREYDIALDQLIKKTFGEPERTKP